MSAGAFVRSRYEAAAENGGGIYSIRIQPETQNLTIATVANDPPAGAVDQKVSCRASGSARKIGLNAFRVRIRWTGTPPTGYLATSPIALPVLTPEARAAYVVGATGTYLGAAVEVIGRSAETIR